MLNNERVISGIKDDVVVQVKSAVGETLTEVNSAAILSTLEEVVNDKLPDAVDAGGGQFVIPVGVVGGEVDATIVGTANVSVTNWPADLASGTNQISANGKLDSIVTNTGNINTKVTSIDNKTPALTAAPTTTTSATPVCQIPEFVPGKQLHVQTTAGFANAASKLLFGFNNDTGLSCSVTRVHCSNLQTSSITGVFTWLYVKRGTGLITLGSGATEITGLTSPALVTSMRDPAYSVPVGFTFWTGGSLGGTVTTLESARWTTDEVSPNGNGLAEMILGEGCYHDLFDFSDDPIVIPDQYSLAVVCDSTATNGQTLVDFNICFKI